MERVKCQRISFKNANTVTVSQKKRMSANPSTITGFRKALQINRHSSWSSSSAVTCFALQSHGSRHINGPNFTGKFSSWQSSKASHRTSTADAAAACPVRRTAARRSWTAASSDAGNDNHQTRLNHALACQSLKCVQKSTKKWCISRRWDYNDAYILILRHLSFAIPQRIAFYYEQQNALRMFSRDRFALQMNFYPFVDGKIPVINAKESRTTY